MSKAKASSGSDLSKKRVTRRKFLAGAAAATGAIALGGRKSLAQLPTILTTPPSATTPIQHIVVVTMENRSFDHFLGWVNGANGPSTSLSYKDTSGISHPIFHLSDPQNCGDLDPNHDYDGGRIQYDGGLNDGWLLTQPQGGATHDLFPIGYYLESDLAFYSQIARYFTVFDNYFCSILAPTYPNRFYTHAAATDRLTNTMTTSTLPTIWDTLANAGLSANYYFNDLPFLALWGTKYLPIVRPYAKFLADAIAGLLPAVSYIDPRFLGENPEGVSNDDHPNADIRNGQALLNQIYLALTNGPQWGTTALIITYDEWGGFFDHVPPPIPAGAPSTLDGQIGNDGRLGFRVPTVLISPYATNTVAHNQYDHCSILNFVESNWGLPALTQRDTNARNLGEVLNFNQSPRVPPQFIVKQGPFGIPCELQPPVPEFAALAKLGKQLGFKAS